MGHKTRLGIFCSLPSAVFLETHSVFLNHLNVIKHKINKIIHMFHVMRMICSCEMKWWSVLDSLVEHGRPSGSSGHAHTKLLLLARHRCVQPPLLTAQWFVPAMSLMVTDLSIMRITHNKKQAHNVHQFYSWVADEWILPYDRELQHINTNFNIFFTVSWSVVSLSYPSAVVATPLWCPWDPLH